MQMSGKKCQVITRQKQTIIKLFDEVAAASLKLGSWREIDLWGHKNNILKCISSDHTLSNFEKF